MMFDDVDDVDLCYVLTKICDNDEVLKKIV